MTARPGQWDLVGHGSDPVPADKYDVLDVATDYETRARSLDDAHDVLDRLSQLQGWTGEAAVAFAEAADDGLGDLAKAAEKYADAARALTTYAEAVDDARTATWTALREAEDAEAVRVANAENHLDGVEEPTEAQQDAQDRRDTAATNAANAVGAAAGRVRTALDALEGAASTCASAIRDASESFDDGWTDDFKGWVRDHADLLKTIVDILEWVAIALAAIAIAIALFVTAPVWLTAGLIVAGIAVAAAILVVDGMLATAGEETWGKVAWDLAGLALSVVGGKLALNAMRGIGPAMARATALSRTSVADAARRTIPQNARNALNMPLGNNLRTWATGLSDDAARLAETGFDASLAVRVTPRQVLSVLDSELASTLARVNVLRGLNVPAATALLDDVSGLARGAVFANISGALGGLDQLLDQVGSPSIGGTVVDAVDDGIQTTSELAWRLTTVF